jgi:hypothetical protein
MDGRAAVALDEVMQRWSISSKTLQRYRKLGLICHYATFPDGVQRLACFEDELSRFEAVNAGQAVNAGRLAKAATFTRVDESLQSQIVAEAAALRAREHLSLNEAAIRLAPRYGRALETVRSILRRHDRLNAEPVFTEPGPLSDREMAVMHRAWRWGISFAALAERFGKTKATVQRAINRRRALLLRSLDLDFLELPTFQMEDAERVILSAPAVCGQLAPRLPDDAVSLIDAARATPPLEEPAEHAMLAAYNLLKRRAAGIIRGLEEWPASIALDQAETDLRWATRLKRRLIESLVPAAILRVEQHLRRPLQAERRDVIRATLAAAIAVGSRAVETVDPSRGQALLRAFRYAMDRELATMGLEAHEHRAGSRHAAGSISLAEEMGRLDAWQPWLEPRADWWAACEGSAAIFAMRYGLAGSPPLTLEALAAALKLPVPAAAKKLAAAEARLRAAARKQRGGNDTR